MNISDAVTDEQRLKAFEGLLDSAVWLTLDMSGTFARACADGEKMDPEHMRDLVPVVAEHGYDAFVAYVALKRGREPLERGAAYLRAKKAAEEVAAGWGEGWEID